MNNIQAKLERLMALGNLMTELKDTDVLMENILTEARKLCACDAGSIYIREGNELSFQFAQNDTQQRDLPVGKKLIYSTYRMPINEKSIAGYAASHNAVLNIPDVYQIGDDVPYSFNSSYDLKTGYRTGSILSVPLRTSSAKIVGVLQLINAMDPSGQVVPFDPEDLPIIKHFANMAAVALERAEMTRAIILRMIGMAELRDPTETGAHVNRVGAYSAELYEAWALKHQVAPDEIQRKKDLLRIAAMLHDVGKVGIPDAILKKPGGLTDEEFDVIKTHPVIGARLFIDPNSELDTISRDIALCHHERWDGSERGYPGYVDIDSGAPLPEYLQPNGKPQKRSAEEIPLWARIVSIADVYDALSCHRSYKEPWTQDQVFDELQKSSGSQFDPELVEIFVARREEMQAIRARYPDLHSE